MEFYLGTHMANWLGQLDVPLFVSHRRLSKYRTLPRAVGSWALDSGGFTELSMHGGWTMTATAYAGAVRRYHDDIGGMDWAAPQDWMCEPWIVAKTGLSVAEHQRRTVTNYLELRAIDPTLPIVPVLQGWTLSDYLHHVEQYHDTGVDLTAADRIGLGSVCRRQSTGEIDNIVRALQHLGLRLHGFGVKTTGLCRYGHQLASADSMAWSYDARRSPPLVGCPHRSCANCPRWALAWRTRVLRTLQHEQMSMWEATA